MEYKILKADSAEKLEAEVTKYMKQGWLPAGGVVIIRVMAWVYYQAIYYIPRGY